VCSTFIGNNLYNAGQGTISDKAYGGLCNIASSLQNNVYNECQAGIDWFMQGTYLCDRTAHKVVNAFFNQNDFDGTGFDDTPAGPGCNDVWEGYWYGYCPYSGGTFSYRSKAWGNFCQGRTAYSFGPDRVVGYNGNNGGGIWQGAAAQTISFGGDVVFSCWDDGNQC
jgi:hypothetical protein